jgi:hypothetical protein
MVRGSLAGCAQRGANVEMACDPGEYQTNIRRKPVLMIENIRTSKYDRCSDMPGPRKGSWLLDYGQGSTVQMTGVHRTNAKNKLTY